MLHWTKIVNVVAGAGLLVGSFIANAPARSAEASTTAQLPPLDSCHAIHFGSDSRWSVDGRVCWDLHPTPHGVSGPIRMQGSIEEQGHQRALFVAVGDVNGDNLLGDGSPRWVIDDVRLTVTTPHAVYIRELDRRFAAHSLEDAIQELGRGIIAVLIGLLLP